MLQLLYLTSNDILIMTPNAKQTAMAIPECSQAHVNLRHVPCSVQVLSANNDKELLNSFIFVFNRLV